MLSPRFATYSALPGGATVTRDGSGAFGTTGVDGRDVCNNLGCAVCASGLRRRRNLHENQTEGKKQDSGK